MKYSDSAFLPGDVGRIVDGVVSRFVNALAAPPLPEEKALERRIERFRNIREQTIGLIGNLSQRQADFAPAHKKWSIAQIADHLLLSEKMYRGQFEKLLAMARAGKRPRIEITLREVNTSFAFIPREIIPLFSAPIQMMNSFVPHAVRETMVRLPIFPATNPSIAEPAPSRPIEQLRAELRTSLGATEEVFRADLPARLTEMTISHPILGDNNLLQVFEILSAHEERHQSQIRSILANPAFPT